MIKRLLVAIDGSDHAARALDLASEIAGKFEAELIALHVVSDKPLSEAERKMAEVEFHEEFLQGFNLAPVLDARGEPGWSGQRIAEQAAAAGLRFRFAVGERLVTDADRRARANGARNVRTAVREGDPATVILSAGRDENADLIVLGRRGLGDIAGLLLGSVSHKVAHLAECACLTVK